jgi:DNA-binding transcriptional regulator LsrR (DeoR family)
MATAAAPSHDFIPVAEAAARLGMSRNSVKRRLQVGLLRGYVDDTNGYHYISVDSIERLLRHLDDLRASAILPGAEPMGDRWLRGQDEDDD